MKKAVSLYGNFTKIAIRTALAHRSAYWAGIVAQWLSYGSTFATLYIMVSNFEMLGDWNPDEMIFMYALNLLAYAIAATFFFNPCTRLSAKIRTGEFDNGLTKPLSPFVHELYMGFNFGYVSHISLSIAVMIFACFHVKLSLSLSTILTSLSMLLGAALVNAAMLIAVSGTSFFMVNDNPTFELFWNIQRFTNYPITIYPVFLQIFLTCILPIAFMNFYPASAILGKDTGTPFPHVISFLTPGVGIVLFGLSILWWNWALSKYQSTGT